MAVGSKELATVELDTFEDDRLIDELKRAKEELFNLRFQSATGQLESHGRLRAVKRDIARIYTVIRERELGIRATPACSMPASPNRMARPAGCRTSSRSRATRMPIPTCSTTGPARPARCRRVPTRSAIAPKNFSSAIVWQ